MKKYKIGVIGCGAISDIYINNINYHYGNVEVVSCSDLYPEKALATKDKYGLRNAYSNEELINDPDLDIILNLTIPAVHYELNMKVLEAGKHLYCEKPLALSVEDAANIVKQADKLNLRVACAPDAYLGPGIQTAMKLIDDGIIGQPIGFTANLVSPGPDSWHPNPGFLFQKGGGPMRDIGPYFFTAIVSLLGPVKRVGCFSRASFAARNTKKGLVDVNVDTNYTGIIEMTCGAIGNINMSFDICNSELPCLEIYGTKGMLSIDDVDGSQGKVRLCTSDDLEKALNDADLNGKLALLYTGKKKTLIKEVPFVYSGGPNMRGVAVADMARAIEENKPHNCRADMAVHVVEIEDAFDLSSKHNRIIDLKTTCEKPDAFYPNAEGLWVESGDGSSERFLYSE